MSEHDCTTTPTNELTAEYLRSALNYNPDTGIFTWKVSTSNRVKVGDIAGSRRGDGYLQIMIQSRLHKAHRLAWLYVHGVWPEDQIDHINRNRIDNQISNLREVSHKQNNQNKGKAGNNTSGHTGVCWHKQKSKWQTHIKHNRKRIHLGYFATIEEAVAARKAGELKYWGVNRAD